MYLFIYFFTTSTIFTQPSEYDSRTRTVTGVDATVRPLSRPKSFLRNSSHQTAKVHDGKFERFRNNPQCHSLPWGRDDGHLRVCEVSEQTFQSGVREPKTVGEFSIKPV